MNKLTIHQIEFLRYIAKMHKSLGQGGLIKNILDSNLYNDADKVDLRKITRKFNWLRIEMETGEQQDDWYQIERYNTPTKYLG